MYNKEISRNFEKIQFAKLREKVDPKFNEVHDELSDCYYNQKPFRNYGILDETKFNKLHGLIFFLRDKTFHEENLKQTESEKIPEEKYNNLTDKDGNIINKQTDLNQIKINELKAEGIELII